MLTGAKIPLVYCRNLVGFKELKRLSIVGEIIQFSSGSRYLSTIPLKNFHLFKIAKSVISFCLKKISNSVILNR